MDLGSYYIPDKRFSSTVIADLKLIHNRRRMEDTKSKDLSALFGYKHPTATPFYHRLNSLMAFGLLEGRGSYKITDLGQKILFPENEKDNLINKSKAILNVPLWKEFYEKFKKNLPNDKLWVDIKNIVGIGPDEAQDAEEQIRRWYTDDIAHVSDQFSIDQEYGEEHLRSGSPQDKPRLQSEMQTISFANKYSISLPKGDLEKEYEKFGKYMELYLEDYKEEKSRYEKEEKSSGLVSQESTQSSESDADINENDEYKE